MKKRNRNIRVVALLLFAFWVLTSCASTRNTKKPCDLDPTQIAPGKAWMQAQDSCRNIR